MTQTILAQEQINYTGRFDFTSPDGPIFAWSGCSVAISFRGSEIHAKLRPVLPEMDDNWVNITIDNQEPVPLRIHRTDSYVLASGLSNEAHTVVISKRTEALVGELQFMGFELPAGTELLPPPARPQRKLQIIGDSITAGYGNEAAGIEDGFKPSQENQYWAYGSITARNLNAELHITAWSGKGMYQNYGGERDVQMPELFLRTLPSSADSAWDLQSWIPDAVVINLGTNDFSVDSLDPVLYRHTYREFLGTIRNSYPNAYILCTIGPMNLKPVPYIQEIVNELQRTAGDKQIGFFAYPEQDIEANGIGGDWHPSLKTHASMAELLTRELRERLGW
ncbi:acetyl xylan esterase [Paenibacillus sp. PR3]|uniref:Acetyl xylan esterase n=1 Tax=Paenibacillus terricola TaxID=2763503 RepID=A0ABR8MWQ6_9BACL|nr:SGNH/GDSL hydrolase family protein [Paenibacillus terricola]MBD3919711.1 acetyl xylan esterase [Paenibacillus terricola]